MSHRGFPPWGWFFLPVAWPGWLATIMTALFCFQCFSAVDRHSHSVSDTLYGIFPFRVGAFTILGWIASHTPETKSR